MAESFNWGSTIAGLGNAATQIADVLARQRQAQMVNQEALANQAVSEKMAKALLKQKEQELQQSNYQAALQNFLAGLSSQIETNNAARGLQKQSTASFNDILAKAFLRG